MSEPKPTVSLSAAKGTVRDGGAYCRVTLTNMSFPVEDTLKLLAESPAAGRRQKVLEPSPILPAWTTYPPCD